MILGRWTTGHRCQRLRAPTIFGQPVIVPVACRYGPVAMVGTVNDGDGAARAQVSATCVGMGDRPAFTSPRKAIGPGMGLLDWIAQRRTGLGWFGNS